MEYYVNTFFLLSMVTILLSHSPQPIIAADDNKQKGGHHIGHKLISKVCQNAAHKDFCNSMLQSDPNIHNANLPGLGLIALRQAASNASDVSEYVKTLLNDANVDPEVQDGASDCLEFYIDAAEQLEDSVTAQVAKAYKDVETWVNVAISDSKSCDASLTGYESVLGGKSEIVVLIRFGASAFEISRDIAIEANEVLIATRSPDVKVGKLENHNIILQHMMIMFVKMVKLLFKMDPQFVLIPFSIVLGELQITYFYLYLKQSLVVSSRLKAVIDKTKFKYHYPFLETNGIVTVDENGVGPLHSLAFPPSLALGLTFIGIPVKRKWNQMCRGQSSCNATTKFQWTRTVL
ncbi:uncharacterized protein LOC133817811 [Humulus lupulus]|uniref:uncharacterized protein LOC133817811 n=1 Tax=Humulus lupulus TaxID=3486 RepID=UPI002B40AD10|nr:uncharacterized protein LOC133817811 [Humulus lupulus]